MTRVRQFPLARRFSGSKPIQQFMSILNEAYEVSDALIAGDLDHAAIETWDVIHSCETMLHILEVQGVDVQAAHAAVELKNAERGYYE